MPPAPREKNPHVTAVFVAVNVLQMVATVVVNILFCVAVYKFHNLRKQANAFLVSLAIVDLLFVVIFVSNIVHLTSNAEVPALCFISAELSHSLVCLVVVHLMAIAIDRLLAITLHLRYREVVTSRRVALAVALIWVFGIVEAFLPALALPSGKDQARNARKLQQGCLPSRKLSQKSPWSRDMKRLIVIEKVVVIAIPYVVILLCYAWIFKIAWRHHRQIKEEQRNISEQDRITKVEMKAAKTTAIIIGSFMVMFTPLLAVSVHAVLNPPKGQDKNAHKFMHVLIPSLKALAATSAFLNPPVYAYRSKPFRDAFRAILQPLRSLFPNCNSPDVSSGEVHQNNPGDRRDSHNV